MRKMLNKEFVLAVSHGDYTKGAGGTDKVILAHQGLLNENGKSLVHICPWSMKGILKKKIWLVHIDGEEIGTFTNKRLINYLQLLLFRGYSLIDIFIHHLKDISIIDLKKLLDKFEVPIYFYLHDYFSICPFAGLVDSEGNYCGSGFPNKEKCANCTHIINADEKRTEEIKEMFFSFSNRLQFIAPSDNTKENWIKDYPQYKDKVRVIYHQTFVGVYTGNSDKINDDGMIRIAFVGYQRRHKGWEEWKKAVNSNKGNCNYEFYQFGWGNEQLKNCKQVVVDFKEDLNAMIYALRNNKIHCAVIWSMLPETYSYTYYEALAANCFIITTPYSGNVCYQTKTRKNGIVAEDLVNILKNDNILRDRINQYRTNGHSTPDKLVENIELITLLTSHKQYISEKPKVIFDYSNFLTIFRKAKNKIKAIRKK